VGARAVPPARPAVRKPVSAHPILAPLDAYQRWASAWDSDPSAIVALESRTLAPWLANLRGRRIVDISCGTGRWLEFAAGAGAEIIGLDFCAQMLERAQQKPGLRARLAIADAAHLPISAACADVVLCTLSLGHMPDATPVIAEMARVTRPGGRVMISDFHPEASRRGWKRTFRSGGQVYEIRNHYHSPPALLHAASRAALTLEETAEPPFGEPERPIFINAGKPGLFEEVAGIPAVWIARWRKLP